MGRGRAGKSLSSDSPRFLRRIKAGPGVETPEGKLHRETYVWAQSLEERPASCAINTVHSIQNWTPGED